MIALTQAQVLRKLGKTATVADFHRWQQLRAVAWTLQLVAVHSENERRVRRKVARA